MKSEEIIKLYKQGKSYEEIARIVKINRYYISKILDECGVSKRINKSEEKAKIENQLAANRDEIIHLYNSGKSLTVLCEVMKQNNIEISKKQMSKFLKVNNCHIRKAGYYTKKYSCNHNAFSEYTLESCYWAGLLAADGCVYSHSSDVNNYVSIVLKDLSTIEGFKRYLNYSGPIYKVKDKYWGLTVNCKKYCEDLYSLFNISSCKSTVYKPPDSIPKDFIKYFVLGYIDGDGSLTYCTTNTGRKQFALNITGTNEMISFIARYFKKENLKKFQRHPENETNNISLTIQGNDQVLMLLLDLYDCKQITDICMKRKYNRFLILKKQQELKSA